MTMYRITATLYYGKPPPLRAAPLCTPPFCQRCDRMFLKGEDRGRRGVYVYIAVYTKSPVAVHLLKTTAMLYV